MRNPIATCDATPTCQLSLRLGGSRYPALAIASEILAAHGQIWSELLADAVLVAELGLDGRARPVRGAVVVAVVALRSGPRRIAVAWRKEKLTLSLDHGVRLTARRSTRRVRPTAASLPDVSRVPVVVAALLGGTAECDLVTLLGRIHARWTHHAGRYAPAQLALKVPHIAASRAPS